MILILGNGQLITYNKSINLTLSGQTSASYTYTILTYDINRLHKSYFIWANQCLLHIYYIGLIYATYTTLQIFGLSEASYTYIQLVLLYMGYLVPLTHVYSLLILCFKNSGRLFRLPHFFSLAPYLLRNILGQMTASPFILCTQCLCN